MNKQLRITYEPIIKVKRYFDLPINEKINVKANSCGFQRIWINWSLTCFRNNFGIVYKEDHPERLTERWFLHHRINKNRTSTIKPTLF